MRPALAVLRRNLLDARTRTLSFAVLFALVALANVVGYKSAYPTLAERLQLARTFGTNKAARLFYGVPHNLLTVGGYAAWRVGGLMTIFAGLFGVFAAVRALRTDEETGRADIVLAGALTRTTAFAAGIGAITVSIIVVGVGALLGLVGAGLPLRGSAYLAVVIVAPAFVYAGVGAVASQVMPTRRGALEAAGMVLGIDFLVRVVADTVEVRWPHYVTPLGWAEEMRPFSGSRPVLLLPVVGATAVLLAMSVALFRRRDLGAGFVAPRDSAPAHLALLGSPAGLAFRLERVSVAVWAFAIGAFAVVVGTIANSVADMGLSADTRRQFAKLAGGVDIASPSGYIGLSFVFFVFAVALFGCAQLGAVREEESEHRLETLFALPYGRIRFWRGRLAIASGSIVGLGLVAGAGAGLGAIATGADVSFLRALEAGLNCAPTALLFLGIGAVVTAFMPRRGTGVVYLLVAAAFLWELFGALLNAPKWTLSLSPFHHIAPAPAKSIAVPSATAMVAIGAAAAAAALARNRARDLAGD
jgi:ABC-2 type transport system permease protein